MKLSIKIPLVYTVLMAFLGAVFIVFTSMMAVEHIVDAEREYFKNLTKTLALNTANAIVLKDHASLMDFVDNVAEGENIDYAMILDEDGMVLAHSRHDLEGKMLDDAGSLEAADPGGVIMQSVSDDVTDVTSPLVIAGKKWGAVRVGFSVDGLNSKVTKVRGLILSAGFFAILLGGAASFLIARRITAPIHKLHKGTEIISQGNLDYRVALSTKDEVEQLARAFNAMTERLQKNYLAIERAKKEWEATFDAISDPLFIHDSEFRVIRCNRAYARVAGMPFREIIGKPYYLVFPKMERPTNGCMKDTELDKEGEEEITPPGAEKTYNASFYLIKGAEGERPYSLHVLKDITAKKKAEEALRDSEEKFMGISASAQDAIILLDDGGNISFWNASAEKIFGYSAHEVLGREAHILLGPGRYHEAYWKGYPEFIQTGEGPVIGKTLELAAVRKDGTEFPMELSVSAVKLKGRWNAIGILRDITERKRADEELHELFVAALTSLSAAIEAKSPWTKGHSERVTGYALKIGRRMGLSQNELEDLRIAGLLHDIGKIGTYDGLLDKPDKLTEEEYEMVKMHAKKGEDMLLPIKQLRHVIPWIKGHHERYDGKGYPDALKGAEIPLGARILAVADTFDSMTAERPYRKTPGKEKALEELKRFSGTQFDPKVVEAFLKALG